MTQCAKCRQPLGDMSNVNIGSYPDSPRYYQFEHIECPPEQLVLPFPIPKKPPERLVTDDCRCNRCIG